MEKFAPKAPKLTDFSKQQFFKPCFSWGSQ